MVSIMGIQLASKEENNAERLRRYHARKAAEKKFGKEITKYYVLKPVYRNSSLIYVPVGNEKLESK